MSVMRQRGAGCNSDHRLLRTKILVGMKKYFRRPLAQTRTFLVFRMMLLMIKESLQLRVCIQCL